MADLTCQSVASRSLGALIQGIEDRLHLGVQIYVSQEGEPIIDDAVGEATPGVPLTPRHRLPWRSAGKPITAAAILKCCENGNVTLDQPVADFIPAFASHGKQNVKLRHLLAHQLALEATPNLPAQRTWNGVIDAICDTPLKAGWNLATGAAYEPVRSWFVLGEILRIVEGRDFSEIIASDWFEPLGMHNVSTSPNHDRNSNRELDAPTYVRGREGLTEAPPYGAPFPSPGSSLRGPIRELGKFYEMLLMNGLSGNERLLSDATVATMTRRHREGRYDETLMHVVDFGLGVICDSNHHGPETVPYGFGRHSSAAAFGHGGVQSTAAFADPRHQLAVAIIFNSQPGEPRHQSRVREFLTQLYVDLGLVAE